MGVQKRSVHSHQHDSSSRKRRIVIGVSAALLVVVALFTFRGSVGWWTRWLAARQLSIGAISEAQQWLSWSARFDANDGETELVQAACFRRLGQMSRWANSLTSSQAHGVNPERVRQELTLGLIRQGAYAAPERHLKNMTESGLWPDEVNTVSVHGYLEREEPDKARKILESWSATFPQDAHVAYMWGVYWSHQRDETRALAEFKMAVARQPQHELAHSALAKLLEKQDRVTEALKAYVNFATHCPRADTAKVGLARALRKLTRVEEARDVLDSLASSSAASSEILAEKGSIELDLGNYLEALRWFAQAPAATKEKKRWALLSDAATAFAFQEEAAAANRIFLQVDVERAAARRASQLATQLVVTPAKKAAAEELKRLTAAATVVVPEDHLIETERAIVVGRDNTSMSAANRYAMYCSACHGANGDGNGRAAHFQFPRPRDFRTGNFRLVSTYNGNPTFEDLEKVIKRGIPGTSMRAFENLNENQLRLLAQEIFRLRREGIRERYVNLLKEDEKAIDEKDVQVIVELHIVPGKIVRVPPIDPADSHAVARGKNVYFDCGCRSCHGDEGTGALDVALFDEKGQPSPPRDLVNDPFKGGHEPESIGLRILAGMPGSPHPATRGLTHEQCVDLIYYCSSLAREPKRTLTNHQRFLEATSRPLQSMGKETDPHSGIENLDLYDK